MGSDTRYHQIFNENLALLPRVIRQEFGVDMDSMSIKALHLLVFYSEIYSILTDLQKCLLHILINFQENIVTTNCNFPHLCGTKV